MHQSGLHTRYKFFDKLFATWHEFHVNLLKSWQYFHWLNHELPVAEAEALQKISEGTAILVCLR